MNSIIAYADLHRNELKWYGENFCGDLTKEQIAQELVNYGVSIDYSKPATLEQLKRMKEDKLRLCYNSIWWANNLVDVSKVKGKELNIVEPENFTYLLTYSFPCQDLSLAGKGAGMEKGSGTRSGLLWEVERILSECEIKPQILLMENVTQVHGAGNDVHFKQWQLRLEELGYQSYWEDLTATEFGIPQTRNRTFMISILGSYNYKFPKKTKLKLRLKDVKLPENSVDEKYYLSEKMINYISATGTNGFNNNDSKINKEIARPITTEQNKRAGTTNYISDELPSEYDLKKKPSFEEVYNRIKNSNFTQNSRRIQEDDVCDTLCARDWKDPKCVIENTKGLNNKNLKETLEKTEIDKIDEVAYLDAYNKKVISDGTAKTILTGVDFRNQDFLLVKNKSNLKSQMAKELIENGKVKENDVIRHSYTNSRMRGEMKDLQQNNISPTLDTRCDCLGIVVKEETGYTEKSLEKIKKNIVDENDVSGSLTATGMQSINHDGCQLVSLKRGYDVEIKAEKEDSIDVDVVGNYSKSNFNQTSIVGKNGVAPTVTENHGQVTAINTANLRIRKLTPKECFRLMGLKDEDIDLAMQNQTDSSGWHLAGDSIVTTCLMAILGQLLDVDWKEKFKPEEWWKNDK